MPPTSTLSNQPIRTAECLSIPSHVFAIVGRGVGSQMILSSFYMANKPLTDFDIEKMLTVMMIMRSCAECHAQDSGPGESPAKSVPRAIHEE